jgi:hypothetical protein
MELKKKGRRSFMKNEKSKEPTHLELALQKVTGVREMLFIGKDNGFEFVDVKGSIDRLSQAMFHIKQAISNEEWAAMSKEEQDQQLKELHERIDKNEYK